MRVETLGPATLYHGDCLDVLSGISGANAVLTDMPYGSTCLKWDCAVDVDRFWAAALPAAVDNAAFCLFADMRFALRLINSQPNLFRYDIVWEKTRATGFLDVNRRPLRAHEFICVFYRKSPCFNPQMLPGEQYVKIEKNPNSMAAHYNRNYRSKCNGVYGAMRYPRDVVQFPSLTFPKHPTEKPVGLMEWLVRSYSNAGDLILDPYMGSGSTGVAAVSNGRRFVGIERDLKYFDAACRRIEEAVYQQSLITVADVPR